MEKLELWFNCCSCYPYDEDEDAPNLEYGTSTAHYRYISTSSVSRSMTSSRTGYNSTQTYHKHAAQQATSPSPAHSYEAYSNSTGQSMA